MSEGSQQSLAKIYVPMAAAAGFVLTADILTKQWADDLTPCAQLNPRPTVGFCLAHNQGMAFSVGWGAGALIAAVALIIVIVLVISARKMPMALRILMGAVAGGALGNVIDRAFRAPIEGPPGFMKGAVVDFFYTSFWATFNVADAAIVVGGILLAIALWRLPDPEASDGGDGDHPPKSATGPVDSDGEPADQTS